MTDEMANPDDARGLILIEGLARQCLRCGKNLCMRQQVLNLALGVDDYLLCLFCLSEDNGKGPAELLASLGPYVQSRQCFYKEWRKYGSEAACPDPLGCLPKNCFSFT